MYSTGGNILVWRLCVSTDRGDGCKWYNFTHWHAGTLTSRTYQLHYSLMRCNCVNTERVLLPSDLETTISSFRDNAKDSQHPPGCAPVCIPKMPASAPRGWPQTGNVLAEVWIEVALKSQIWVNQHWLSTICPHIRSTTTLVQGSRLHTRRGYQTQNAQSPCLRQLTHDFPLSVNDYMRVRSFFMILHARRMTLM